MDNPPAGPEVAPPAGPPATVIKSGLRWPLDARTLMVGTVMGALSHPELKQMQLIEAMPIQAERKRLSQIYDNVFASLIDATKAELEEKGLPVPAPEELPSRGAVGRAAVRWTLQFLARGHVHDKPPHVPGYRVAANVVPLTAIKDLILEGWVDGNDEVNIFRSLHDLSQRRPDAFAPLLAATKLTTLDSVWNQLRALFPRIQVVSTRVKKIRDPGPVQV